MKSIERITAFICASVCTVTPFMFVACGDDNSNNKGSTIKGEQITEQQWREAIENTINLKNVKTDIITTSKTKGDDTSRQYSSKMRGAVDFENYKGYSSGTAITTESNKSSKDDVAFVFYLENDNLIQAVYGQGDMFAMTYAVEHNVTNPATFVISKKYAKCLIFPVYMALTDFHGVSIDADNFQLKMTDLYSTFTYDEKTTEYTATLYKKQDMLGVTYYTEYTYSFVFKDNYIAKAVIVDNNTNNLYDEAHEKTEYYLYDYNNTDVVIPENKLNEIEEYLATQQ